MPLELLEVKLTPSSKRKDAEAHVLNKFQRSHILEMKYVEPIAPAHNPRQHVSCYDRQATPLCYIACTKNIAADGEDIDISVSPVLHPMPVLS
jgi:hypothetical protein